ncbi:MAG: hypothetical protein ACI9FU_000403 [Granulosicoccus sp.]|jgi:hypothetical protein
MKYILTAIIILSSITGKAQEKTSNSPEELIRKELARQQECWNSGDLECFMDGYWKSDSLRFIGSSGIKYGWQETLDNYHKTYPDKAAMGTLTFELLGYDPMGAEHVMVTGKWRLKREKDEPNGLFTIIWQEIDGAWKIIYDHSS